MGVVNLGFAIDEGDWYTVGLESVAASVTIAPVFAAKKSRPKIEPQAPSGTPAHRLYALVN